MDQNQRTKSSLIKENNFFLPNFCAVKSVFILSIGAQLIAFMLILATGDILSESWDELGLLSVYVQWIALASAGVLCMSRHWLAKLSLPFAAIAAYLLIVLTTGIIAACAQYLLLKVNYQWGSTPETIGQFVTRCVSISAILALVALRYFYIQQQWKQRIELESQARVEALQSRIRPHFLFNSMNIIASLIQANPLKAEQAVEDLSEIFRATLRDTGSMVPLSEEWVLCRNYLRIEGLRLGDRLTIDADLTAVPEDAAIPMLTLQPLMENAIYHGIQALESGGTIRVEGTMLENMICIRLSNPVPPPSQRRASQGNQIAMANIGHRLNLLFGSHAKLKVNAMPQEYEVTLIFPYLKSGV
ncbi:MAG: histidine kinase [Proteobacteria bacterium]|nr:histidine kinase [Pseudomonadota bacterium]